MKILITGGSGSLGSELNNILSIDNQILSVYNSNIGNCRNFNSKKINITNSDNLENLFDEFKPDVVVHTAAVPNPAIADKMNHRIVYDVNVNATQKIAELCKKHSSKLIYTSTDLVYAGYRGTMLTEDSKLVPISLYAETKLMGEVKIREAFSNYLILRMSLMFGIGKYYRDNHFNKMYNRLKNRKTVSLFTNQFRTPISFCEAAKTISELIKLDVSKVTLNLGGKDKVSRYEMGKILCEEAKLDKSFLSPVKIEKVTDAYQVADVSMNTNKLQFLKIKQKSFRKMIRTETNKLK